jgi:hypothetical protein
MEASDASLERAGAPHKMCASLQAALKTLDERGFEYPWNGLEEAVAKMPENKLSPVGYGSLLNRNSAAVDIKETPRERVALNADYTRSPTDALNGCLLTVAPADIVRPGKREFGYDLRPVVCVRWLEWEATLFTGYVLVAAEETRSGRQVIDNDALPHQLFAGLCRAGAHAVSEAFLQLYLETTFLADRKTRLAEWEKDHPEVAQEPPLR